jgi:hypothetical protein
MTISISGHTFRSFTPGEQCIGAACEGIQSLVELTSVAKVAKVWDRGIAHTGSLSPREYEELKQAADRMEKLMGQAMGF